MTEMTEVKYTVANISIHAAEPRKSTACSAGYDLFATRKNIVSASCNTRYNRNTNENS